MSAATFGRESEKPEKASNKTEKDIECVIHMKLIKLDGARLSLNQYH
jgi:hypothetical protein